MSELRNSNSFHTATKNFSYNPSPNNAVDKTGTFHQDSIICSE